MRPKLFLLFICLIGLIGCLPAREPVAVTRPVVVTAVPTEVSVSTAVPPTHTPPPTTTQVVATTAAPTNTPLPTSTPEPAWPTTPILFVRDGALHRWLPQTNEVELLAERVDSFRVYAPDIAVFMREVVPKETFALIVFHIPTRTEVEVLRQPAAEITNNSTGISTYVAPLSRAVSISPNGRWLVYSLEHESGEYSTLFIHEIQITDEKVTLSEPIFVRELPSWPEWRFDIHTWPTENEFSWNEPSGIWIADLNSRPVTFQLEILASTNTFLDPPMNPADDDKGPQEVLTIYQPYRWSPDGQLLLATEYFSSEGLGSIFRILDRNSMLNLEIPDSKLGPVNDSAIWLDDTHILHFQYGGLVRIWQISTMDEPYLILEKEFQISIPITDPNVSFIEPKDLTLLPNQHIQFRPEYVTTNEIYDLNLLTQELDLLTSGEETRYSEAFQAPDDQFILWAVYENLGERNEKLISLDLLNAESPIDMSYIFGTNSCCWYWEE